MARAGRSFLDQGKPWRSDVKWEIVAVEAVILLAVGLFMLIDSDRSANWLLQIIGLVFLVVSFQLAAVSLRNETDGLGSFDSFRAGIGVTIGVIATSLWWSDYVSNNAVRIILGWGLVAYAALQLLGLVQVRGRSGLRPATIAHSALTLVLGILLLTSSNGAEDRIQFLGVVLLVFGVLLAGLAFLLKSRDDSMAT